MEMLLKEKVAVIDRIILEMSSRKEEKNSSLLEVLREEIKRLHSLNEEYEAALKKKTVSHREDRPGKTKYILRDGSLYVVNKKYRYRYLYDSRTNVVTYEFENGQVERTFPGGIKEIRYPDGKLAVKTGERDYDIIK